MNIFFSKFRLSAFYSKIIYSIGNLFDLIPEFFVRVKIRFRFQVRCKRQQQLAASVVLEKQEVSLVANNNCQHNYHKVRIGKMMSKIGRLRYHLLRRESTMFHDLIQPFFNQRRHCPYFWTTPFTPTGTANQFVCDIVFRNRMPRPQSAKRVHTAPWQVVTIEELIVNCNFLAC